MSKLRPAPHAHGCIQREDDHLTRLRCIERQARGLQRLVEDEKVRDAAEAITRLVRS